jgi:hypothetical protein
VISGPVISAATADEINPMMLVLATITGVTTLICCSLFPRG